MTVSHRNSDIKLNRIKTCNIFNLICSIENTDRTVNGHKNGYCYQVGKSNDIYKINYLYGITKVRHLPVNSTSQI